MGASGNHVSTKTEAIEQVSSEAALGRQGPSDVRSHGLAISALAQCLRRTGITSGKVPEEVPL